MASRGPVGRGNIDIFVAREDTATISDSLSVYGEIYYIDRGVCLASRSGRPREGVRELLSGW